MDENELPRLFGVNLNMDSVLLVNYPEIQRRTYEMALAELDLCIMRDGYRSAGPAYLRIMVERMATRG